MVNCEQLDTRKKGLSLLTVSSIEDVLTMKDNFQVTAM